MILAAVLALPLAATLRGPPRSRSSPFPATGGSTDTCDSRAGGVLPSKLWAMVTLFGWPDAGAHRRRGMRSSLRPQREGFRCGVAALAGRWPGGSWTRRWEGSSYYNNIRSPNLARLRREVNAASERRVAPCPDATPPDNGSRFLPRARRAGGSSNGSTALSETGTT